MASRTPRPNGAALIQCKPVFVADGDLARRRQTLQRAWRAHTLHDGGGRNMHWSAAQKVLQLSLPSNVYVFVRSLSRCFVRQAFRGWLLWRISGWVQVAVTQIPQHGWKPIRLLIRRSTPPEHATRVPPPAPNAMVCVQRQHGRCIGAHSAYQRQARHGLGLELVPPGPCAHLPQMVGTPGPEAPRLLQDLGRGACGRHRAAHFLSRSSRRRILPTGVLGSSVRNSITRGCL